MFIAQRKTTQRLFSLWRRGATLIMLAILMMGTMPFSAWAAEVPSAAPLITASDVAKFMDDEMSKELADNHIPGALVAVVKDGKVLLAKGYGMANLEQQRPVDATTTSFRVGSISKLFTWTAVMQLAEQGKVDLHADVNTYLKTFQIPSTYPQPITLADLLTHTAGFEERSDGIATFNEQDILPLGTVLASHVPARVRPPGQVTAYSNYGAALAGYIVEQVSGVPFDQYVQEHILAPLNMAHSSAAMPLPEAIKAARSEGYSYLEGQYKVEPQVYVQMMPAGSVNATAPDMANFMIAHLQDGRFGKTRILSEVTAQLMHAQHFTNDARLPGQTYGFAEATINSQHLIWHAGDLSPFTSLLTLLPEHGVGLFVSYNSDSGKGVRWQLEQKFLDHYFPATSEVALLTKPLDGFAQRADAISGKYLATRRNFSTFEKLVNLLSSLSVEPKDGHIILDLGEGFGAGKIDMVEVEPWVFRQVNGQELGSAIFHRNEKGQVTSMVIQNIPVWEYTKMPWYDNPLFNLVIIVGSVLLFLLAIIVWCVRWLWRLIRRRPRAAFDDQAKARISTGFVYLLNILVFCLVAYALVASDDISTRVPIFKIVSAISLLAIIGNAGVFLSLIPIWRKNYWTRAWRVHYTLSALPIPLFIWALVHWNFL